MRNRTYIIMNSSVDSDAVGVFYYPMGQATFQAQRQSFLTGIFVSLPIDGSSSLTQWSKILWDATLPTGSSLSVFTRSAASVDALSSSAWNGPLYNSSGESLSSYHGRYIQVKIVLSGIGWTNNTLIGVTPVVQSFSVQGIVSGSEEKMYTKAFDLGFVPKYFIIAISKKTNTIYIFIVRK